MAQTGSIAQAADRLRRAQSALSRSVRELETLLGVSLFERHRTGMVPTRFAEALLARGQQVAAELQAVHGDFEALSGRRLGAAPLLFLSMAVDNSRLAALIAMFEERNMASAARHIGVTQPAVSASIHHLEAGLGVRLFDRTPVGMKPTLFGESLAMRAKRAFAELRHAESDISALKGALRGRVTVGALPFGRTIILPRAIDRLLREHPGLHVSTIEGPYDTLAVGLRSGDIDFIFGALRERTASEALEGEIVIEDCLSVLARRGHPLASRRRLRLEDLVACHWVLPRHGTPARKLFESMLVRRGLASPKSVVESSSLAIVRALLMDSDRVTVLSRHQVHYELQYGMLTALPVELSETWRPIGIIQRTGAKPSPGGARLMALLHEVAASLAKETGIFTRRRSGAR